ncbi:MAG: HAMP domain-containing histidine kinase [Bacteroidales bacterium]|nr:HAMP domain-containing histidine kinase [Bacteroidales bacterium]
MTKLKSVKNTAKSKHRNSKSPDKSNVISDTGSATGNIKKLNLQEINKFNFYLENLVEKQSKELIDVIATNTKFISIIAHDLRSPFISILNLMDIVKENLHDKSIDTIENYINLAADSAKRTLKLLDDLLDWTISQNKERNFNPVKINLYELLEAEFMNHNTSAIQKQITLEHSVAPGLNVTADLQMVKTILRNLISNAIKFTNTGGKIIVSAIEIKPFVEIAVKDNGIGISSQDQKELFNIQKLRSTAGTNNEKGTGLGLLLCKEFVDIHNGNILVESAPGKGCEIKFTLPHYI